MVEREHVQAVRHAAMLPAHAKDQVHREADDAAIYRHAVQGVSNRS